MTVADLLRRQFAYDAWANQEVIAAMRAGDSENERPVQLMSHIVAAERLWLERLKQQPQTGPVWRQLDLDQCADEAATLKHLWEEYLELATAGDVAQTVSYKNTKGEEWTNTILDILTHVIMHSAYHRGQIASYMREHGQTPAYTDYIHGVRQGQVK